jgi:hypothetical protein
MVALFPLTPIEVDVDPDTLQFALVVMIACS